MVLLTGKGTYIVPTFTANQLIAPTIQVTLDPTYQADIDFNYSPDRYYKLASISLLTYDFLVFKRFFIDSLAWISDIYYPHENYSPEYLITVTGNTADNHQSSPIALSGTEAGRTITGTVNFSQKTAAFTDQGSTGFCAGELAGSTVGDVLTAITIRTLGVTQEIVGDIDIPADSMELNATSNPQPLTLNGTRLNYNSSGSFSSDNILLRSSQGRKEHDLLFIGYWADVGVTLDINFFTRSMSNRL